MASSQSVVDFITDQLNAAGQVTAKKLFGEYGVYCNEKIVGVICDDTLFIKPTAEGLAYCGDIEQAPPYKGAKPSIVISAERLEDREWLTKLVQMTYEALPAPKKRKPRKKKADA